MITDSFVPVSHYGAFILALISAIYEELKKFKKRY